MWLGPKNRAYSSVGGNSLSNAMGTNFANTGTGTFAYDGIRTWKNEVRNALNFGDSTGQVNHQPPLDAAGWPAADFCLQFASGTTTIGSIPWANGTWNCGFTSKNGGLETVAGLFGTTVSATSVAGPLVTFTITPNNNVPGIIVTGTTGGVTNIWAYPPTYSGLTGIDNPLLPGSFTNECIGHYSKYAYLRFMQVLNTWKNTTRMSSSNRLKPTNCQVQRSGADDYPTAANGGFLKFNTVAVPTLGDTSVTLSNPWPNATGDYAMYLSGASNANYARFVHFVNGSVGPYSFPNALTQTSSNQFVQVGIERTPVELVIALANACNVGVWINQPWYEDGTNGAAGTWTADVCQYLAANWTSTGNIYFEDGNENWNGTYLPLYMINAMVVQGGYADSAHLVAERRHICANVCRANLPAGWWGTRAFQVNGCQSAMPGGPFAPRGVYNAMNASWGNPSADCQYTTMSPYATPNVVNNNDSIATIEADFVAAEHSGRVTQGIESEIAVGLSQIPRGGAIKLCTYEAGGQWNGVNANAVNVGAAILDTGMIAPLKGLYDRMFTSGVDFATHFGSGLAQNISGNRAPENNLQLVQNSAAFFANPVSSSPPYAAISSYFGGFVHSFGQRNVIHAKGDIIQGYDYVENDANISTTLPNFTMGATQYPHSVNGYLTWVLYCLAPQTYALDVTYSTVGGGVTSDVEVNGTVVYTGVALSSGLVHMGNIPLIAGWNYVTLGRNTTQTGTVNTLQFN